MHSMAFPSITTILFGALLMQAFVAFSENATFPENVGGKVDYKFYTYYNYLWGSDHFYVNPQQTEATLKFDKTSGAGFRSKYEYGSGLFHIRMKLPYGKTGGLNTNFYLTSAPDNQDPGNHFELDFEFLGTNGTVQTNVYDNDQGHREQSFKLWFDPSSDFHIYEILWNPSQIVFSVDRIPIRVFKNNAWKGIPYPTKAMHIEASLWNAPWAGQIDWSKAPFYAHYSDFGFGGCPTNGKHLYPCDSNKYFWNKYTSLSAAQYKVMQEYRSKFMTYDYCWNQSTKKPECSLN